MATYYVDPWNGSDSNDSTAAQSTSTPWKTLWNIMSNGPNQITLSPGDTVKIKGKAPTNLNYGGSDFAWSNNSSVFTTSDKGNTIVSHLANVNWTNYGSVSGTASNAYIHLNTDGQSRQINIPTGSFTGKAASQLISGTVPAGTVGFSIAFRSASVPSGFALDDAIQIKLCSDTAGDTAVITLDWPDIGAVAANKFVYAYVPYTVASDTSFSSIGIYIKTGYAAAWNFILDNLVAVAPGGYKHMDICKAPDGSWNPISAFTSDGIITRNKGTGTQEMNFGNNQTRTTTDALLQEAAEWDFQTTALSGNLSFNVLYGTSGSLITIQGGYDDTYTNIIGNTVWQGYGQLLTSIRFNSFRNVRFNNIGFVGYGLGTVIGDIINTEFNDCVFLYTNSIAFSCVTTSTVYMAEVSFKNCTFGCSITQNMSPCGYKLYFENCHFTRSTTYNMNPAGYIADGLFKDCKFSMGNSGCVYMGSASSRNSNDQVLFDNCEFFSNATVSKLTVTLPGGTDPGIILNDCWYYGPGAWASLDERTPSLVYARRLTNGSATGLPSISVTSSISWPHAPKLLMSIHGYEDSTGTGYGPDFKYQFFSDGSSCTNLDGTSSSVPSPSTRVWELFYNGVDNAERMGLTMRLGYYQMLEGETKTFTIDAYQPDSTASTILLVRSVFCDGAVSGPSAKSAVYTGDSTWDQISLSYTAPSDGIIELCVRTWAGGFTSPSCRIGDTITIT